MNEKRAYQFVDKLSEAARQVLNGEFCKGLFRHKSRIDKILHSNEAYFDLQRANQVLPALNIMNRANRLGQDLPPYVRDFVGEVEEFARDSKYIIKEPKTN